MSLVFKKTKPKHHFAEINKMIHGLPKSGKTTLCKYMIVDGKEPLFITTEDGHDALEVYAQKVSDWNGFRNLVEYIEKNAEEVQKQHSCFVLDLVTDLDQACARYIETKHNISHVSDLDFGKGWSLLKTEFQEQIKKLMTILPCTFIALSQDKELMWNGEKIKTQAPSMSKGALEFINGKVDAIIYVDPANSQKEYTHLVMQHSLTAIAGCRYPHMVKKFKYDHKTPEATYALIQKTYETGFNSSSSNTAGKATTPKKVPTVEPAKKAVS